MSPLSFRPATPADVDAITRLVNSAYRGDSSRAGWTTEADLLGGQRTDADEVRSLIAAADSILLLAFGEADLVGCVHLEKHHEPGSAYLGMFTIKPVLQGRGLGKQFLAAAEQTAVRQWGVRKMVMTVISVRDELIAFYERRGYRRTGEHKPFPAHDPRFGIPRVADLRFAVMERELNRKDAETQSRE